ncbi:hypothetical protein EB75_28140 [Mycobacterium sp. ST-F2]|nr:hypothetical protein EB75_28140 [Mycobacterium sp. ST-F2]
MNEPETWRDLADQLTPDQIDYIERSELHPVPNVDGTCDVDLNRGALLFRAREFARQNVAAERFRHVQAPVGADQVDAWWPGNSDDGSWSRTWWGKPRGIAVAAAKNPFTVVLTGMQWSDGRSESAVTVHADDDLMTAAEARQLAVALLEVADALTSTQLAV